MRYSCELRIYLWGFCIAPLLVCRLGKTHHVGVYDHRDHRFCRWPSLWPLFWLNHFLRPSLFANFLSANVLVLCTNFVATDHMPWSLSKCFGHCSFHLFVTGVMFGFLLCWHFIPSLSHIHRCIDFAVILVSDPMFWNKYAYFFIEWFFDCKKNNHCMQGKIKF